MTEPQKITLTFVEQTREVHTRPLDQLAGYPFEVALPIRRFPAYRDQRNLHSYVWFSKTNGLVACESLLERDAVLVFDYDPDVVAVSAQPFRLRARVGSAWHRHTPDFFLRLRSGRAGVVDVSPAAREHQPARAEKFDLMRAACARAGWDYSVVTELPPALRHNLHALAGFRREPGAGHHLIPELLRAAAQPTPIGVLERVGDVVVARPLIFHLIWHQTLRVDLAQPLSQATLAVASAGSDFNTSERRPGWAS